MDRRDLFQALGILGGLYIFSLIAQWFVFGHLDLGIWGAWIGSWQGTGTGF